MNKSWELPFFSLPPSSSFFSLFQRSGRVYYFRRCNTNKRYNLLQSLTSEFDCDIVFIIRTIAFHSRNIKNHKLYFALPHHSIIFTVWITEIQVQYSYRNSPVIDLNENFTQKVCGRNKRQPGIAYQSFVTLWIVM